MMKNSFLDFLAKLEFWYAKNFIKLDKHYTFFVDLNGEPGTFAIKFLKKYNGVIVEYGDVKVGGDGQMTFNFDVISNVNNCDVKSKSFMRFTTNVMHNILLNAIDNSVKDQNENGNTDTLESGTQRTVHEEVSAVSENRVSNRKPRKKAVRRNKTVHSKV